MAGQLRPVCQGRLTDSFPELSAAKSSSGIKRSLQIETHVSARKLINPPKTFEEVDKEARKGHDLYIVSHNDYYVDEAINRKYDLLNFVLQKLDHTFGVLLCPDEYGVGDLLHTQVLCEFLCGEDRGNAVLTAVQQSWKKANYENFDMLLGAFRHYDKNGDGMIDKNDLQKSCFQLNINLDEELLDSLFDCCDLDKDGLINYLEFANFLNWKDKMAVKEFEEKIIAKGKNLDAPVLSEGTNNDGPLLKQEDLVLKELGSSEKTSNTLTRSSDRVFGYYQTTSSQYNAVVGGLPTTGYPVCGVPSICSDISAPWIRRISDRTNYGDDASAYVLLFPSVFSQKGVYERDFFKRRPKAEIAQILHHIGMNISDERFEEIWKQACMKDQKEKVCLEGIRNVLDEINGCRTKTSC